MVRNIYVSWDMVFVRYRRSMYIYIYIFFFLRNVFVKYMEVWGIWRLNVVNTWAYSCCWSFLCVCVCVCVCVMSWVMLLLNKRDFVRELEKEMEMCLWAAKWWSFWIRERESKYIMGNGSVVLPWKSCGLVLFI